MKINRNNYEAYFLDYIEGNLSKEKIAELKVFISENPDMKEELESFENLKIVPEQPKFDNKSLLKKPDKKPMVITRANFDEYCVARLEGDLDEDEIILFDDHLKNNNAGKKDIDLYTKTKLQADKTIAFSDKHSLKKTIGSAIISNINFEEYCIAYYEKQLSETGQKKFLGYLDKNPGKTRDFELFGKSYLTASESIVFENKKSLKRSKTIRLTPGLFVKYASAAAAVLILFLVITNLDNLFRKPIENIAQSNTDENLIEKAEQFENQLAANINDNKKTDAVKKEQIKKQAKELINKTTDTVYEKPVRHKNLKPIIINSSQNFQFSLKERTPQLNVNYSAVAKVEFNFDKEEIPSKQNTDNDYLTVNEFVVDRFKRLVLGEEYRAGKEITYLDLARAGISGIDKITPGKLEFKHKENEEGEVEYLALNTKYLGYSKTFKK